MELDALWSRVLEQVVQYAAHDIKDSLNGVSLNLEVVRTRTQRASVEVQGIAPFANAAADQLEVLAARIEALLYLSRPARDPADVALTLKHLGALLVPAAKSEGGALTLQGHLHVEAPTRAAGQATRLGMAAALLALTKSVGKSHCVVEAGSDTLVRFSHESAGVCVLDPAVASALANHSIRVERSDKDLILVFPGTT